MLAVQLQFPLSQLKRLKPDEMEEFDAMLTLADGTQLPLQVSPRGKSRRVQCDFPPIRLDFKRKATQGTPFEGQNKLKLVTHCSNRMAKGGYLAAEMLVYRLFNLLTDTSFRVRALEVTYFNTDTSKVETWPAFLIEHKKDLAARVGGELLEVNRLETSDLDASYASLSNIFAMLVGNTDFSLLLGPGEECCHNAVPIQLDQVVSVPYDFDATGLVNAPYAKPSPSVNIRRVTQRIYRGYCDHNHTLSAAIDAVQSKQAAVMALAESFNDIPGLKHDKVAKYLARFFELIADPKSVDSKIFKRCR